MVERELHEAWRRGYEEGRNELAQSIVPEIVTARFGPEARETARAVVTFTNDDRLAEIIVRAATCTDFDSFYVRAVTRKRKRRR